MRPLVFFPLLAAVCLHGQNLADFEKRVTEFTLANGLHFIVMERHEAPVVSFHLHVDSGAANDPANASSTAHMFEHMIGKGTVSLGTKNWPEEEKALQAVEAAYDKLEEERVKGRRASSAQLERLKATLDKAIEKANSFVDQNAFTKEIERNGGVGFNASTALDYTNYFYSLPANRTELWFALQSEWTARPVFREFYKERDVVREERRMRVESGAQGKLIEALLTTSFTAHPYRNFIGWASDIENLRAKGGAEFHKTYYVPGNMCIGIVGDVNPAEIKRLAEKYFGPIPAAPLPPRLVTREPQQIGIKRVTVEDPSQPLVVIAYHRPDGTHADDAAIDVLNGVLSSGRTSILYKEMVRDKKIALGLQTIPQFPGGKYPNLFLYFGVPNQGKTADDLEKSWDEIIARVQKDGVDEPTVKRVKVKMRAGLLRALDSNSGLAGALASNWMTYGDWRKMFTDLEELDKVTPADVQRVAKTYLLPSNKTVGVTVQPKKEETK
ncbi:MAG: insulinase family protein [Acidobacteria bacterium]|nr:insulinase family protein [Acidobacteriota bacterium]